MSPRDVAAKVVAQVAESDLIDRLEVAGPGFVNIFLKKSFVEREVQDWGLEVVPFLPELVVAR